jgi:TolB protein
LRATARRAPGLALAALALGGCGSAGREPPPPLPAGAPADALAYERILDGNQDIYVVPSGGGVERRLTRHPALDSLPRWTPEGTSIQFYSERTGTPQLFEVPEAGGEPRRIRSNRFTEYQVAPSPDGERLTFLSNMDGAEALYVMDRATGRTRQIVRHGDRSILGNPDWSPDGTRILFSSNWRLGHHIYQVGSDGGEARRVTAIHKGGCEARFHPDGRRMVYVSRGHLSSHSQLVERDLETGEERVLVDWPALNYDPAYSPDGSELAFASDITGEYFIYRQRLSDGKSWRVTFGPGPTRYPDYRPLPRD